MLVYAPTCLSVCEENAGRHIVNAVTVILNGILKPRLQGIGTLNFYEKVKQLALVNVDQHTDVYKIRGV
jgi:hypothetical protein